MSIVKDHITELERFAKLPVAEVERELAEQLMAPGTAPWINSGAEAVQARVKVLMDHTRASFVGRDREIELLGASFVSGISLLLLGPPGTAKSRLAREFALRCGVDTAGEMGRPGGYFEYLLTNHTMPEEIFGGPSLQKLAEGRFERNVEKKLPRAEIAFLDEVFRGGSHILNTLLTVINEKRFDSGDGKGSIHVPLLALIGASNAAPNDPDLEAFFDRFPVRVWIRSVFDQDSRVDEPDSSVGWDLLIRSTKAESQRLAVGWSPDQATAEMHKKMQSCTNDFRFARAYLLRRLQRVRADDSRFVQFDQMFRLVRERAKLSDRSYTQLWLFAGALDWLRGNEPDSGYPDADGHLEVFRYVARSEADVAFLDHQVSQHSNGVHHTGR
jgi:MoxR-like ATPase